VRRAGPALALGLGAAAVLASAPIASAASRTATLEGWHDHAAALAGRALIVAEAATAHVDPRVVPDAPRGAPAFDYYRAEVSRLPLDRARRRFAGLPDTPVAVRTSIARMGSGILAAAGRDRFVAVPSTRAGAPPVIWCCDAGGTEVVVESDGRPDAPVALAAAEDSGGRVRFLLARADGNASLVGVEPVGLGARRTDVGVPVRTAPGLVALAPGLLAWVDPATPTALLAATPADGGLASSRDTLPLPGSALRVWATPGTVVVAVRAGSAVRLVRWDDDARAGVRVIWSGRRLPRVAVGSGSVAVADGRRVLAGRRGGPLRLVHRARGPLAAVAVDGRRVAWLERGRRRGARVTVARLGVIP